MLPTLFRKIRNSMLMGIISFPILCTIANAQDPCCSSLCVPPGTYVGVFGGYGNSGHTNVSQSGIAFFAATAGGPLDVHATGHMGGDVGFVGGHVGYEWCGMSYCPGDGLEYFRPAAEFEGYYLRVRQHANLTNPTTRMPEHLFHDTFPMNMGVFLINGLVSYKIPCLLFTPYVGVGVGTAVISVNGADSLQTAPFEVGVNHFNSNTHSGDKWVLAAQGKAGVRLDLSNCVDVYLEYRFLYLSSTTYRFGPTVYPTHAPTTGWRVNSGNLMMNMGAIGIDYKF